MKDTCNTGEQELKLLRGGCFILAFLLQLLLWAQVNGARRRRSASRRSCTRWRACRRGRRSQEGSPGRRSPTESTRAPRNSVVQNGWTTWTGSTAGGPSGRRRTTWTSCAGTNRPPRSTMAPGRARNNSVCFQGVGAEGGGRERDQVGGAGVGVEQRSLAAVASIQVVEHQETSRQPQGHPVLRWAPAGASPKANLLRC